jgi:hypothetical protein
MGSYLIPILLLTVLVVGIGAVLFWVYRPN